MISNHGNLYITLLALVLRLLWSTHAEVNGTEEENGENGDGNGYGNGESGPEGVEQGRERRKGRWERVLGAAGAGAKMEPISWGGVDIRGSLRVGQCRLGSAPITSVTGVTVVWSRHYGGCPRSTWTWASFKR